EGLRAQGGEHPIARSPQHDGLALVFAVVGVQLPSLDEVLHEVRGIKQWSLQTTKRIDQKQDRQHIEESVSQKYRTYPAQHVWLSDCGLRFEQPPKLQTTTGFLLRSLVLRVNISATLANACGVPQGG